MHRLLRLLIACVACLHLPLATAKTQIQKCIINGTVTFQQDPCPVSKRGASPTVQQLNAARKKRLDGVQSPSGSGVPASLPLDGAAALSTPGQAAAAPLRLEQQPLCDGRRYCSQMTSCTEAKFFLAHCPGVKMDGDRDGVPCEQQWCTQ
ncbi:MAG: excalibur calcium-binding domain-containing protein [Burkholderiaceae bacterium]